MNSPKAQKRALPVALLVDDDPTFRQRLARALSARQFTVHQAGTCADGLQQAQTETPQLVVLDLRLPGGGGLEAVADFAALAPRPCILMLTGYGSIVSAVEAVKRGAADYLTKPADADQIVAAYEKWRDSAGHAAPPAAPKDEPPTPTLTEVEWNHIHRVLADCAGNVSEAARRLGLHRRSLQRKLEKRIP